MLQTYNYMTPKSRVHPCLPHLMLDDEVGVIETLYDGHLILKGQFRILLDHIGEGLQAYSNTKLNNLLQSISEVWNVNVNKITSIKSFI